MTTVNDESASKDDGEKVSNSQNVTSPLDTSSGNEGQATLSKRRANEGHEVRVPQNDDNNTSSDGCSQAITDDGWKTTMSTSSGDSREPSPNISDAGPEINTRTNIPNNPASCSTIFSMSGTMPSIKPSR